MKDVNSNGVNDITTAYGLDILSWHRLLLRNNRWLYYEERNIRRLPAGAEIGMFLVPMLTAAVIDELHRPGDSIMAGKRILH